MADEHFDLSPSPAPPPTEADYDAILAAVMETMRGRWFLAEYAQRNRTADTSLVLAAIARVEEKLQEARPAAPLARAERVRMDLVEMATAIAKTRAEIASIKPEGDHKGSLTEASAELDSIVHATERATSDILAAAEQVQEIAWTLREHGIDCEACDALDRRAADIYTACSFQDLTGQRTHKVVEVLRFLEQRINAMIEIWGDTIPSSEAQANGEVVPHIHDARDAERLDQRHVDEIMPSGAAAAPHPPTAGPSEPPEADAPRAEPTATSEPPAPKAAVARSEDPAGTPSKPPEPAPPEAAAPNVSRPSETPSPAPAAPASVATPIRDEAVPSADGDPAGAIEPAVAVVGAAAMEASAPEVAPAAEPVSIARDEVALVASAERANPAAVLERILAIIHEPIESAPDDASLAASSSTWPPTTAPSRGDGAMPFITLERAANPTHSPTRMPAPPPPPDSIEPIPFAGYSRPGRLPVVDPMDDIFELPAQVEFAATPPAGARPLAMSDPSPSPAAAVPPSPVAVPQPAAVPEQIAKPEPAAQTVLTEEPRAADRVGARVLEAVQPAPAPQARPEPAQRAQPSAVINPGAPAEPARVAASPPRPIPSAEQRAAPLRSVPEPTAPAPPDRLAATNNPAASMATPPVIEAVAAPAPRVATASKPAVPPRADALAAFTALSEDEKIALFS